MKIIAAPDSFKGSMSAKEAAEAMKRGILRAERNCDVVLLPMADGGEGFVEAMATALQGEIVQVDAFDPLGRKIRVSYALADGGKTAVIETAAASGLTLLKEEERNPLKSDTFGTGILIRDALDRGCRKIFIGLGGSATNDGGIGLARALGYRFLDKSGQEIDIYREGLREIARIDAGGRDSRLDEAEIVAACDVDTLLYGENGASSIFGPQKGATPDMVPILDRVLESLAEAVERDMQINVHTLKGGGAAGGLGAGLAAFCRARLQNGIDLVLGACRFDDMLPGTDLVLTGEGQTDEQTLMGKVPVGLGKRASVFNIPVVCLSGGLGTGYQQVKQKGISAVFSMISRPVSLAEAMERAPAWMEEAACEVVSLWTAARKG